MKKALVVAISLLFLVASSFPVLAAQQSGQQQPGAQQGMQQRNLQQQGMAQQPLQGFQKAGEVVGKSLKDQQGQELGKIEALVVGEDQRASYVIISGDDQKMYPIPTNVIQRGQQEGEFQASISKDQLQQAPSFEQDKWPNITQEEWQEKVHGYYDQQPQPQQQQKRGQESQQRQQ
jgi:hypothetical protein